MTETPGLPSAIGIEAIERLPQDSGGVTVRVTGRWRRRRPEWRGPAVLVIEAEGHRRRIPAMPEPPSLTGTLPGTWRMSFSVPPELAASLEGRTWLQLGAVMAPLALPVGEEPGVRFPVDPELLAARELRSYEVAAESARRRAEEADARAVGLQSEIARLEAELEQVRREPERLRAVIEEREREMRTVRQQAYAEAALRAELEEQLAGQEQDTELLRARVRAATDRARELERALRQARRAVDEARHEAAIARATVAAPPTPEIEPPPPREPPPAASVLRVETARLAAARASVQPGRRPTRTRPRLPAALAGALAVERRLLAARPVATGTGAEAADADPAELTAAVATLEAELGAMRDALALEREAARAELAREREARAAAEERVGAVEKDLERQRERSARALRLVVDVRREIERLSAPAEAEAETSPSPPTAPEVPERPEPPAAPERPEGLVSAATVEPGRLSAALERLREQHPSSAPPSPDTAGGQTGASDAVPRLFKRLLRDDAAAAGRLVIGLLPAQRLVHPRPVAYDLILGAETCLRVTVGSGAPEIELSATPRPAAEVQFQLATDPTGLARLLAAGRLRRLLRGRALEPLRLLVRTPLRPRQLLSAGVELDPPLVLQLVAVVAEANPSSRSDPWSAVGPPLFTLAHRLPSGETIATLHVQAGGRATVTATGLESPAATTVTCPPGRLLAALLGERGAGIAVEGDDRPLGLVRSWLERA